MKIKKYRYPKSSFLSIDKDLSILLDLILSNDRLKKLLYYTDDNPLMQPALTDEQSIGLINNQIRLIPKIYIDDTFLQYIVISFGSVAPISGNPHFRNAVVQIDIVCHYEQWQLKDMQLRPFKIAAELDAMLTEARLTGIGNMEFLGSSQNTIAGKEYATVSLLYGIVHGEEDKNYFDETHYRNIDGRQNMTEQEFAAWLKENPGVVDDRFERAVSDEDLEENFDKVFNKD